MSDTFRDGRVKGHDRSESGATMQGTCRECNRLISTSEERKAQRRRAYRDRRDSAAQPNVGPR